MLEFLRHRQDIIDVLVLLHAAALIIVNLTPTPKDDNLLAKGYRVIELMAGIIGARVKQ